MQPIQYKLTSKLARLLGIHTATRPDIINAVWQYVKVSACDIGLILLHFHKHNWLNIIDDHCEYCTKSITCQAQAKGLGLRLKCMDGMKYRVCMCENFVMNLRPCLLHTRNRHWFSLPCEGDWLCLHLSSDKSAPRPSGAGVHQQ